MDGRICQEGSLACTLAHHCLCSHGSTLALSGPQTLTEEGVPAADRSCQDWSTLRPLKLKQTKEPFNTGGPRALSTAPVQEQEVTNARKLSMVILLSLLLSAREGKLSLMEGVGPWEYTPNSLVTTYCLDHTMGS